MITALLIDDEQKNSVVLQEMLRRYCPSVSVLGIAVNTTESSSMIQELQPQLIFLDIQMPGGSGFDLLDSIKGQAIEVIFVTAYDNYLLKAIRYSALDYILKPVNLEELIAAVYRAEQRMAGQSANKQMSLLLHNIRQPEETQQIAIPVKEGYEFILVREIIRLQASRGYTEIFHTSGKTYLTSKNIKEYEDLLPATLFCRVHAAHLVNVAFIRIYHRGRGGYIELKNGDSIEVSVRRKEQLLSRFGF
ncbi:MAG: response regulator transcription factor [Sphingobacteriales bacterium]|nr:MAG: response regulator transcription factor [Sphingobacteriales bacterium]